MLSEYNEFLQENKKRNACIVEHYVKNKEIYGKNLPRASEYINAKCAKDDIIIDKIAPG